MNSITFTLVGDVTVAVTITEMADGSLKFDLKVDESTGTIGDLNGLFFDIADESLLDGLAVSGDDVTEHKFDANSVTKVDSYNSVNGEVAKDYGKFDAGIQFGTQGMAKDDIQETSFTLSHADGLSIDQFLGQDFAVRLTSVGEINGAREDSSKIGGTADPIEEPGPINIATDDMLTVSQNEGFNDGFPDLVNGLSASVLENDLTDTFEYTGIVTGGNGTDFTGSTTLVGSNGGLLILNDDGSIDFSANNEFDFLSDGEFAMTQFDYTIEGGSTANIYVEVFGGQGGPGGGGDDLGGGGLDGGGLGGGDIPPLDDPFLI